MKEKYIIYSCAHAHTAQSHTVEQNATAIEVRRATSFHCSNIKREWK